MFKKDPLQIIAFQTYGTRNRIYLRGRGIEDESINLEQKGAFKLLFNAWKRFDTDEPNTLFDLINDPDERINLIDDPQYADIVKALDTRLTAYFDEYSTPEFDLWRGGSAKAILLDKHYGRNDIFRDRFPNWREPFTEKAGPPFRDASD